MNLHIKTVIVAPMTTQGRPYPTRVVRRFQGKMDPIVLDPLRTVDKARLVKRLEQIGDKVWQATLAVLAKMFAELASARWPIIPKACGLGTTTPASPCPRGTGYPLYDPR